MFILYVDVLEPTCTVRLGKGLGIRFFYLFIFFGLQYLIGLSESN